MNVIDIKYDKNINNEQLIEKAKLGCSESKDLFFQNNIPLVKNLAKKWRRKGGYSSLEEIMSIGFIGLTKAYNYFDPSKGYKFTTLASTAIWREFIQDTRKNNRSVRTKYDAVSIDADDLQGEVLSRHETIADKNTFDIYYEVETDIQDSFLKEYIEVNFNEKEKKVAYGTFFENKTLTEIGMEMSVSRQAIHQMYHRVIKKLSVEDVQLRLIG